MGVIYISGYAEADVRETRPEEEGAVFVRKPFEQSELLACVRHVLGAPAPGTSHLK
jgi:hypothetical protein